MPAAPDLGKHMLLTTFRRNGQPVATPVWNVPLGDGRIGMWTAAGTGKWKRMRANQHVTVQACSARGKVKPGAPVHDGVAEILPPGPQADAVRSQIRRRYPLQLHVVPRIAALQGRLKAEQDFGDTIVVITPGPRVAPAADPPA